MLLRLRCAFVCELLSRKKTGREKDYGVADKLDKLF